MERAGFEVQDVEAWRLHYARTCRLWCERLTAERERAVAYVCEGMTCRAPVELEDGVAL